MSKSENSDDKKKDETKSVLAAAFEEYRRLLQTRPVLTKSITNGAVSAFGNILAQIIAPDKANGGRINFRSVFAYSSFGFLLSGPLVHNFYVYLEKTVPKNSPGASIKRLLFDRFIFAPPFLLIFMYYISIVEGAGNKGAVQKLKETYWMILKLNWTVWGVIQYLNINYVPIKYRTLVGNLCGLIWMVFLSIQRRK